MKKPIKRDKRVRGPSTVQTSRRAAAEAFEDDDLARGIADAKMMEGIESAKTGAEYDRSRKAGIKDSALVDMYGGDAMSARSFATDRPDKPKKKKKTVKKMGGGMMKYNKGGKVRGHGMARGGRPCKMVSMKGS